ncbi:hypothetical protein PF003_g24492 [Phytophthora fragariae]|nr:hypothetical protein PF003_g24492 [Phytophthora fragariae]
MRSGRPPQASTQSFRQLFSIITRAPPWGFACEHAFCFSIDSPALSCPFA